MLFRTKAHQYASSVQHACIIVNFDSTFELPFIHDSNLMRRFNVIQFQLEVVHDLMPIKVPTSVKILVEKWQF